MPRTVGAKDKKPRKAPVRKPKKVFLTKSEVDLAAKLGVTPTELAIEKVKLQRKPRKKKPAPVVKYDANNVYRWIRINYLKHPDNSKNVLREGWVPVTVDQQPSFKDNVNEHGHIEIGGLILCMRPNINWESIAKDLQKALRDEIDENQALSFKVKSLEHQIVGFQAVISYLESKSGHDTV